MGFPALPGRCHLVAFARGQVHLEPLGRALENAQQREQPDRQHQEQARRPDVAPPAASEIFASEQARPADQGEQRAPHPPVEGHVAAGGLAQHCPHGRQRETRLLPASRAVRSRRLGAAVAAHRRHGPRRSRRAIAHGVVSGHARRASTWSMRARMPRRILTSSFSRRARANRRRRRGSSRRGWRGSRKRMATSVRCAQL